MANASPRPAASSWLSTEQPLDHFALCGHVDGAPSHRFQGLSQRPGHQGAVLSRVDAQRPDGIGVRAIEQDVREHLIEVCEVQPVSAGSGLRVLGAQVDLDVEQPPAVDEIGVCQAKGRAVEGRAEM